MLAASLAKLDLITNLLLLLLLLLCAPSAFAEVPDDPTAPTWRGISVGSRVQRGPGWTYGDQDGGLPGARGTVVELRPWRGASSNGTLVAARVRWDATGAVNAYRWDFPGTGVRDLALVGWRPLSAEEAAVPSAFAEAAAAAARRASNSELLTEALRVVWRAWGGPGWRASRGWAEALLGSRGGGVYEEAAPPPLPPCGGGRAPGAAAPRRAWEGLACSQDHDALLGVDLSGNGLSGSLGGGGALAALAALPREGLASLSLSRNALNGALPETLCQFTQLRFLDLSHNALTGPLPACLGDLALLEVLALAGNPGLVGPLPARWARLRALLLAARLRSSGCAPAASAGKSLLLCCCNP